MTSSTPHLKRALVLTAMTCALAACATSKPPAPAAPAPAAPPAKAPPPPAIPRPVAAQPAGPTPGSVRDFVVNVGDRVYFDFDQYQLSSEGRALLARQAAWLNQYPAVTIRIEGNCDERGTRDYNLALGDRRANAVKRYLVELGVRPDRMATISYGKEQPMDTGSDETAWAHNRNAHTALTGGTH